MQKTLWIGGFSLLIFALVFAFSFQEKKDYITAPSDLDRSALEVSSESTQEEVYARNPSGHSDPAPKITHPFPHVARTRDTLSIEDDPFGPTSRAEQTWLDNHGFPNKQQWDTYMTASNSLLEHAADAGDRVAKTMLDARLLATDPQAKTRLVEYGAEGNLFALNMLASYLAGSRDGDLQAAYAVSRVAEMKGDLRLGPARDSMMTRQLNPLEKINGEADAMRLYNQLDQMYKEKHGVNPPESVSRPLSNEMK